jgi:hypothetical protein
MKLLQNIWQYIKNDWNSYPLRFCAEFFAWTCSVISAVIFAATVPNIPVIPLYTIFISGCIASGWACYTRKSFGLMINSIFLVTIDLIGLVRMISKTV